jgi:hypothetical protein
MGISKRHAARAFILCAALAAPSSAICQGESQWISGSGGPAPTIASVSVEGASAIIVKSDPEATVEIDGVFAGRTPLRYECVGPGWVSIVVSRKGYETASYTMQAPDDEVVTLSFTLVPTRDPSDQQEAADGQAAAERGEPKEAPANAYPPLALALAPFKLPGLRVSISWEAAIDPGAAVNPASAPVRMICEYGTAVSTDDGAPIAFGAYELGFDPLGALGTYAALSIGARFGVVPDTLELAASASASYADGASLDPLGQPVGEGFSAAILCSLAWSLGPSSLEAETEAEYSFSTGAWSIRGSIGGIAAIVDFGHEQWLYLAARGFGGASFDGAVAVGAGLVAEVGFIASITVSSIIFTIAPDGTIAVGFAMATGF